MPIGEVKVYNSLENEKSIHYFEKNGDRFES